MKVTCSACKLEVEIKPASEEKIKALIAAGKTLYCRPCRAEIKRSREYFASLADWNMGISPLSSSYDWK